MKPFVLITGVCGMDHQGNQKAFIGTIIQTKLNFLSLRLFYHDIKIVQTMDGTKELLEALDSSLRGSLRQISRSQEEVSQESCWKYTGNNALEPLVK